MFGLCTVNWILWKLSLLFVYFFHGILVRAFDSIRFDWNHLASFLFYSVFVSCAPPQIIPFHCVWSFLLLLICIRFSIYHFIWTWPKKPKKKQSSTNQYVCVLYIVFNVFVCLYLYLYIRTVYVYVSRVIFFYFVVFVSINFILFSHLPPKTTTNWYCFVIYILYSKITSNKKKCVKNVNRKKMRKNLKAKECYAGYHHNSLSLCI